MLSLDLVKEECKGYDYQLIFTSQQINVLHIHSKNILVCQVTADINLKQFKESLLYINQVIKKFNICGLVFDKRHMLTIHHPSMEWFYLEWLEQVNKLGLKTFYKILPENELFRFSLQIGREKILSNHPHLSNQKITTYYCNNLREILHSV